MSDNHPNSIIDVPPWNQVDESLPDLRVPEDLDNIYKPINLTDYQIKRTGQLQFGLDYGPVKEWIDDITVNNDTNEEESEPELDLQEA